MQHFDSKRGLSEAERSANRPRFRAKKPIASSSRSSLATIQLILISIVYLSHHHQEGALAYDDINHHNNIYNQTSHSIRVAAYARKLEQWFNCQRYNQLAPNEQLIVASSLFDLTANNNNSTQQAFNESRQLCGAQFDGHLCWPVTRAGARAELSCPRSLSLGHQFGFPAANSTSASTTTTANSSATLQSIKSAVAVVDKDTKLATRMCQPANNAANNHLSLTTTSERGLWQAEADYSACALDAPDGVFDETDHWIKLNEPNDERLFKELVAQLERIEGNIDPYSDPDLLQQWTLCIANIMRASGSEASVCPIIFDGWRCWPSTKAGEIAYVSCPSNQPGFSAERKAHKICTLEADWYRHPLTNRYWSNYTTCVDTVDLAFRTKILNLYVIGNLISLIALTISLIIFISFKSLNCTRVTIHKNLFLSFITNNLMWIIWYTYVVNDADLLQSNPIECQFWHVLLHYFLVSNYFWMFCEGLYLHTILVVAFVSENKILKWFYLLGWFTPLPITIAYAYNRSYDEYYTNFCWMEESPHNVILMAPIGISLLLNLVFLINIVRVLVTKLRANNHPDTHQTRKAVRATLILIPLLGLHYILTPFRPEAKSEWEVIYEIIAAVCTSFQGLCVALLFCFCNGEVIAVVKKKLKDTFVSKLRKRRANGNTTHRSRSNTMNSHIFNTATNSPHINYPNFEDNHALRHSMTSNSTNNGDLMQANMTRPIICPQTNGTNSNSSSVLTTITTSPIASNHLQHHNHGKLSSTNDSSPMLETKLHDNPLESATVADELKSTQKDTIEEERIKLLDLQPHTIIRLHQPEPGQHNQMPVI